jgi:hypothetical protein
VLKNIMLSQMMDEVRRTGNFQHQDLVNIGQ